MVCKIFFFSEFPDIREKLQEETREEANTIKALIINRACNYDDISIRMIKLCDQSIVKLLSLTFDTCLKSGIFSDTWKKSNIVLVHKKVDRQQTTID